MCIRDSKIAEKTAYIRNPHDYVTEKLTGNGVTDRGDASGTGWWSSRTNQYIKEVLDHPLVSLKQSVLPKVLEPNDPAGSLIKSAADWTGLKEGIPVACGTGDNAAAALGLAINPGTPVISLGTSGTAYLRSKTAPRDVSGQVFAHASASGDHLPLTCTLNATLAVDNIAKLIGIKRESVSENTNVVMMPFLSGERLPNYPNSRGSLFGVDHSTTSGDILLAAYEGVVYSLVESLEVLNKHSSGIPEDSSIILVGGGAKGKIWQDTVSRLSGRNIIIPKSEELVAYGAASQAAGDINNEKAIDISKLRAMTGYVTLDKGFKNTGSTTSAITFLDGEKGILRYRGYDVEELAKKASFLEVAYLLIFGELPSKEELLQNQFRATIKGFV